MVDLSPKVLSFLGVWVALGASMIIFNAALLKNFRHPMWLSFGHMFACSLFILCLRLVRPDLLVTGDETAGVLPLTFQRAFRIGFPVAVAQVVGLIAGNTAVMYISVSFCQMIKAWTPACVFTIGCLVGTQQWSMPVAQTLAVITVGLMIASFGEVEFVWYGFLMQVLALLAEGMRINLLEIRLKSEGYKLNALTSLQVFAPIGAAILLPVALALDKDEMSWESVQEVGLPVFAANIFVAVALNIAIYLAIQTASGLTFTLAGIFKDIMIITGSILLLGTRVTLTQLGGYSLAMVGLQGYGIVSKAPTYFELTGLFVGLWKREEAAGAPSVPKLDIELQEKTQPNAAGQIVVGNRT